MDSTAFDVPGVTWNRVSLKLARIRRMGAGIGLGVPLVGLVVLAFVFGGWWWLMPAVFGIISLMVMLLIGRQVRAISYTELEEDLLIRKGVLFRKLTVVPYGRMQYVDVQAGPMDRRAGIATVQLHTASASSDATIPGLLEAEAARLRDRLTEAGEARLAGL
ncbi:MAG: PH domain-containing protein [Beutenbergiaceae bacterium]